MESSHNKQFHLGINRDDIKGAETAIIPGDPKRVKLIAELMENAEFLANHREFMIYLAQLDGKSIVICSTGIGGPSTSIAVEELAQLGVKNFLRIGTTGAIQDGIKVGDIIISTGSVRLDGASQHFAPLEFPAVADFDISTAMKKACDNLNLTTHTGVTASSDTFYPGQERYDTHSGRVVKRFQGSMDEWKAMGVLNFEMESATLFTMCASQGLKAGCLAGVIINRNQKEIPDAALAKATESNSIKAIIESARLISA